MKLTNRIAAFQNVTYIGSEGGRRPSERSPTLLEEQRDDIFRACEFESGLFVWKSYRFASNE